MLKQKRIWRVVVRQELDLVSHNFQEAKEMKDHAEKFVMTYIYAYAEIEVRRSARSHFVCNTVYSPGTYGIRSDISRSERIQIAIKIPPSFAGKASNIVRSFGTLLKDQWAKDGSYICLIEIPAGIQQEVYDRLNNLTHGQVEVKIVKKI